MAKRRPPGVLLVQTAVAMAMIAAPALAQNRPGGAAEFLAAAEAELEPLWDASALAAWVNATNASAEARKDSENKTALLEQAYARRAAEARRIDRATATPEELRKLHLLKLGSEGVLADAEQNRLRARIVLEMEANYAEACPVVDPGAPCMRLQAIETALKESQDPDHLRRLWTAWYDTATPLRALYPEYVRLTNIGARDSGYSDAAELSKAANEVEPATFEAELDQLWRELAPLYSLLHAFVRNRLVVKYGASTLAPDKPIPMHLLGNLWGQDWESIASILALPGKAVDNNELLRANNLQPSTFAILSEHFFVSLGFPALPMSFHERSHFTRPRANFDCHPSAWRISATDWRITACFEPNWSDLLTAHHELGHIFYFQSFAHQAYLFRDANAGINEAIGDAAALSVTADYLARIGWSVPSPQSSDDDLNQLMQVALRKLPRVQFGLMLQKWRWSVMSGKILPDAYNRSWWRHVTQYQGLVPASDRPAEAFDPGAKFHIAADVDYVRYFLADMLTFQIHAALAREASCTLPIHRCSIYGSKAAGDRWRAAMAMGASKPWPEVLMAMTGESRVSANAIRAYFAPLESWLRSQTAGLPIGWAN